MILNYASAVKNRFGDGDGRNKDGATGIHIFAISGKSFKKNIKYLLCV
jgi:hypothetical protein